MIDVIHICIAMKPIEGNFAQNALEHGVGGLNVDGCRVLYAGEDRRESCDKQTRQPIGGFSSRDGTLYGKSNGVEYEETPGRFPANVILDGSDDVKKLFPQTAEGRFPAKQNAVSWKMSSMGKRLAPMRRMCDKGSASRFFKNVRKGV